MADIQSNIRVNIDTNSALASLKVLQSQISAFHQQMARTGAAAASDMSRLQNNFMTAVNRSGQFNASMKTIKTTTESFTTALEKNKLSMGEYFRYAGASTKTFGKLFKGEFDTINKVARERVKDLQTQYIKMGRDANGAMKAIAVRPLMLDMDNLGTKTQIAAQRQQLLNQLLKQGSTNMLNWGKNTQWAGRQLMVGFTVPLTMLGQVASKTFMDMEQQVIKFQRVYGDLNTTVQDTKDMTNQVEALAKSFTKYGVAVSDTMGMAADAAAMGKQGADLLAQVQSATTLSVLGGVDQQKALETTISLTNAFGISADQLKNKINFLNAVENQSVLSIDDMTTAIPKAAPVVKQLGGNVEDLAFFLTAMKEGGINASEGANALKSGLASMINPSKKATDMLSSMGVNLKGIVQADKGNVKQMIIDLGSALNDLEPLKRAQAIEQLFGKFQFSRISTLLKNVTDANSQATTVSNLAAAGPEAAAILAQREMKKIEDSPLFKFKKAIEDLKVQLIPLGEQFLKAVTPIAKFLTDVLTNFNKMSDGTKNTIGIITGVVAGIGPIVLMVVGLIANGIANMIKMFAGVKSFFNNLGKSTKDLGSQTQYMTQEQIEARAVAASLDQIHEKLSQTFTSEASAVAMLRKEMERAVAVQDRFMTGRGPVAGAKAPKGKKFATGGVVVGPGGPTDDKVPANLSNGEVVLSVDNVKKNPAVVAALLSGAKVSIPGYAGNGIVGGGSITVGTTPVTPASEKAGLELERFLRKLSDGLKGSESNIESVNKALDTAVRNLQESGSKIGVNSLTAELNKTPEGQGTVMTAYNTLEARAGKRIMGNEGAASLHLGSPTGISEQDRAEIQADLEAKGFKNSPAYKKVASGDKLSATSDAVVVAPTIANKSNKVTNQEVAGMIAGQPGMATADFAKALNITPDHPMFKSIEDSMVKALREGETRLLSSQEIETLLKQGVTQGIAQHAGTPEAAAMQSHLSDNRILLGGRGGESGQTRVPLPQGYSFTTSSGVQVGGSQPTSGDYMSRATMRDFHGVANDATKGIIKSRLSGGDIATRLEDKLATEIDKQSQAASPSKKMKKAAKNIVDGIEQPIKEAGPAFKKAAEKAFVISPASMQHAQDQMHKILKPFTDSAGNVNIKRLNDAYRVHVHLITEDEKKLRQASEMLRVARMPQDALWKAYDNTKIAATKAAISVRDFGVNVGTKIKSGMDIAVAGVQRAAGAIKTSVTQMASQVPVLMEKMMTKIKAGLSSAVGRLGAVTGAMGMATMIPGQVGEAASNLMGPMFALQMLFESGLNPATMIAIAAVGGIAFAVFSLIDSFNKAQDKAIAMSKSMGVGAESLKKYTALTNKVTASEIMDERRKNQGSLFKTSGKAPTTGDTFVKSDDGKAMIKDVADTIASEGSAAASAKFSSQLVNAVIAGALTPVQARSIADSIGQELGDQQLAMKATADINNLFGPDGKSLTDGSFKIYADVIANNNSQLFGANQVAGANAVGMNGSEGTVMNRLAGNVGTSVALGGAAQIGERAMVSSAQAGLTAMESGGTMSAGQKVATFASGKLASAAEGKIGSKLASLGAGKLLLGIAEKTAAKYAATAALSAALGPETAGIGSAVVEVGTTIWSLVDAYQDISKMQAQIATDTAAFAADSAAALSSNKQSLDAMDLSYEKRKADLEAQLEIAKSKGDEAKQAEIEAKLGTLKTDYSTNRTAVLGNNAATVQGISDAFKNADGGFLGMGDVKGGLTTAIEKTITDKFAGTGQEAIASKVVADTANMTGTDEQKYVFKNLVASGQLDLNQAQQYQSTFGGGEGQLSMTQGEDMIKKFGGAQVGQIMNASQGLSAENQQQFILDISSKTPEEVQKQIDFMAKIQSMGGTMDVKAIMDMAVTNPGEFAKLQQGLDDIQNIAAKNITIEVGMKVVKKGLSKADQGVVDGVLKGNKYFKSLSRKQKLDYLTVVRTQITAAKTPAGIAAIVAWGNKNGKIPSALPQSVQQAMAGQFTSAYIADMAKGTVQSNDAAGAYGDGGGSGGGGGGGGTKIDKNQRKMDYYNGAISQINKQEEKINKAYDERMKALDKIQAANDKINQQKKDELDLADALSKGDIGAAARAQQQARQTSQNNALSEQRDAMTAAKDAQIGSLTFGGKTKDQWQALADALQQKLDLKEMKKAKAEGWAMGGSVARHFASGGMMNYLANGKIPHFKPMGKDTIPAMLQQGEYVVKKSAVDKLGAGNMSKINRGEMPTGHGGSVYNYSITVNSQTDASASEIAHMVMTQIKKMDAPSMRGNKI